MLVCCENVCLLILGNATLAGHASRADASTSSSNPVASSNIGGTKASTLNTGSVMDILTSSGAIKPHELMHKPGSRFGKFGSPKNVPSLISVKPAPQIKQGSVMDILGKGKTF